MRDDQYLVQFQRSNRNKLSYTLKIILTNEERNWFCWRSRLISCSSKSKKTSLSRWFSEAEDYLHHQSCLLHKRTGKQRIDHEECFWRWRDSAPIVGWRVLGTVKWKGRVLEFEEHRWKIDFLGVCSQSDSLCRRRRRRKKRKKEEIRERDRE